MDRLILLRHGKAEPDSASGEDFDRRLARRGTQETVEIAARLADLGFAPDLVLVSSAARTRETWEAACAIFPGARARFDAALYLADPATVRQAAATALEDCATVMVVGHNPGLQELTVQLLHEGAAPVSLIAKAQRHFPTAAAAVFLFDDNGRPQFDGLFVPER